jgi:RimJ/RimL family protein N-acetyltransferase
MELRTFAEFHRPALERDEVRHNLILGFLHRLGGIELPELRVWTLGAPGECALQTTPRRPLILGELTAMACAAFADVTTGLDYAGVVGVDDIAPVFVAQACERGAVFAEPVPQLIQALRERPIYSGNIGLARLIEPADFALFADWMVAFLKEAAPHDPLPSCEDLERTIADRRFQFWIVDGAPVAMAGIVRRTRNVAAIAGVYTPPALRGRGYAAAVTAAVVDSVFAEGRTTACLYSDLRNLASNRCYAKIGFKPVCRAWHYLRV